MFSHPIQKKACDAVAAALPFAIDPAKVTVEPGMSYLPSPIKLHDYAVGVMAAFGSVVEHLGRIRGLPAQTMTLNRRLCGFHLNELQVQMLNGYSIILDSWPVGADNGTYRTKDGRYVQMIGLFPHMVNPLLGHLQCANTPQTIQAAVEKHTAQQLEDDVAGGLKLALGMVRTPQEWLAHPEGAATAKLPLVDIDQQGVTKNRVLGTARYRPLEGVRVVDLTNMVAGPTAGVALAEQGADVIAVRRPHGDWVTPIWLSINWGKSRSLPTSRIPTAGSASSTYWPARTFCSAASGPTHSTASVSATPSCAKSTPTSFTGPSPTPRWVPPGPGAGDLNKLRRQSPAPCTCIPRVWGSKLLP
jgi:hypothetical protein